MNNRYGTASLEQKSWRIFKRNKQVWNGCMSVLTGAVLLFAANDAQALGPTGEVINSGVGSVSRPNVNETIVDQSTGVLDINWNDFSSSSGHTIRFNSSVGPRSVTINTVDSGIPSFLDGALLSAHRIFVQNSAGIVFGPNSQVNVGALLATTSNLTGFTTDGLGFLDGATFDGTGAGTVANQGDITVSPGGFAFLIAPKVMNTGSITADVHLIQGPHVNGRPSPLLETGRVELASAQKFAVDLTGSGQVMFEATRDDLSDAEIGVTNTGDITAHGGEVTLSAHVASALAVNVINVDGGLIDTSSVDLGIDINGQPIVVATGAGKTEFFTNDLRGEGGRYGQVTLTNNGVGEGINSGDVRIETDSASLNSNISATNVDILVHEDDYVAILDGDITADRVNIAGRNGGSANKVALNTTINTAQLEGESKHTLLYEDGHTQQAADITETNGKLDIRPGVHEAAEIDRPMHIFSHTNAVIDALGADHGLKLNVGRGFGEAFTIENITVRNATKANIGAARVAPGQDNDNPVVNLPIGGAAYLTLEGVTLENGGAGLQFADNLLVEVNNSNFTNNDVGILATTSALNPGMSSGELESSGNVFTNNNTGILVEEAGALKDFTSNGDKFYGTGTSSGETGINVGGRAGGVEITNATFEGLETGVELSNAPDASIVDSTFTDMGTGVDASNASYRLTVADSEFTNVDGSAISVSNSNLLTVREVDVTNADIAVEIDSSNDALIEGLTAEDVATGVDAINSRRVTVTKSSFTGTAPGLAGEGILLDNVSNEAVIRDNDFDGVDTAITIIGSNYAHLDNVRIQNAETGVILDGANHAKINGKSSFTNVGTGVDAFNNSDTLEVTDTTFTTVSKAAIQVDGTDNMVTRDISIDGADTGIKLTNARDAELQENTNISNVRVGVDALNSRTLAMNNSTISNASEIGVSLDGSFDSTLTKVKVTHDNTRKTDYAVKIVNSDRVVLDGVEITQAEDAIDIIDSKNVELKDVKLVNVLTGLKATRADGLLATGLNVDNTNLGSIVGNSLGAILFESNNVDIVNTTITNTHAGIVATPGSDGLLLDDVTVTNGDIGVQLIQTKGTEIRNSKFNDTFNGITALGTEDLTVDNTSFTNTKAPALTNPINSFLSDASIVLDGVTKASVTNNKFSGTRETAIDVAGSTGVTVDNATISDAKTGINVDGSGGTRIVNSNINDVDTAVVLKASDDSVINNLTVTDANTAIDIDESKNVQADIINTTNVVTGLRANRADGLFVSGLTVNNTNLGPITGNSVGVQLFDSEGVDIVNATLTDAHAGIVAGPGSDGLTLDNVTVEGGDIGLQLVLTKETEVLNSKFNDTFNGITALGTEGLTVDNTSFTNTKAPTLSNPSNSFLSNTAIVLDGVTKASVTNNTTFSGTRETAIDVVGSSDVTVDSVTITDADTGINIDSSDGTRVLNSNISDVDTAVILDGSDNSTVDNLTVDTAKAGVEVSNSDDATVQNSTFTDATIAVDASSSNRLTVDDITVTEGDLGVGLFDSDGGIVRNSEFNNTFSGIFTDNSDSLTVEANSFNNFAPVSLTDASNSFLPEASLTLNNVDGAKIVDNNFNENRDDIVLRGSATDNVTVTGNNFTSASGNYFRLEDGALNGQVLDASDNTYQAVRASDFNFLEFLAAESRVIDFEDTPTGVAPTVGDVFFQFFPGFSNELLDSAIPTISLSVGSLSDLAPAAGEGEFCDVVNYNCPDEESI